ncbi:multicopper oxidase domain-containing protein [Nocardia amikacinitolerans]|uniref:multicopper oxidase domain-containing protein n=1 Tax=Nocardia amikacinitolerans TaxID=756689 RepID=UPI003557A10A
MVPALPRIMRFTVAGDGPAAAVPARLRGGDGQPAPLEPLDAPQLTRTMTMMGLTDTLRPPFASTLLALNNLPFRTTDVDVAKAGTVEQWDLINATPFDHPIHLHLARMRILGRQPILTAAYWLANRPGPPWGTRWNPPADAFVRGPQQPPQPWEPDGRTPSCARRTPSPASWCTGHPPTNSASTPTPHCASATVPKPSHPTAIPHPSTTRTTPTRPPSAATSGTATTSTTRITT